MARVVLLAEDSGIDAEAIKETLRETGVPNEIFVAEDGEQAIAYLSGIGQFADRSKFPHPTVLLLDLKMPKIDGFGVLEWLKANPPPEDCLIVVLSGMDDVWDIRKAYDLGADTYLLKPLNTDDLRHLQAFFRRYWE